MMVEEILSHKPKRIPLWKTYSEFKFLFKQNSIEITSKNTEMHRALIPERLVELSGPGYTKDDFIVEKAESKHVTICPNNIMIDMGDIGLKSFTDDIFQSKQEETERFFYVFVPRSLQNKVHDLKQEICRIFT